MQGTEVFLSYSSADRDRVIPYYEFLARVGLDPWMDQFNLQPGQNWQLEISRAMDRAPIIVIFVSKNSVDKRGFVQREIKVALSKREEKLIDDVYIIPVQLDEVPRPEELKSIQFLDGRDTDCLAKLEKSIREQLTGLELTSEVPQKVGELFWSKETFRDQAQGTPGYSIEAEFIGLESRSYEGVRNISDYIRGVIADEIMTARNEVSIPEPENYNLAQDVWSRTFTTEITLDDVVTCGRALSIGYSVYMYRAGAAHPNTFFRRYNFFLSPVTRIRSLAELFEGDAALPVIQHEVRKQVFSNLEEMTSGSLTDYSQDQMLLGGTESWDSFNNFELRENGIHFSFSPYDVAAYACGPQFAEVPYDAVVGNLTERAAFALDLSWQRTMAREAQ